MYRIGIDVGGTFTDLVAIDGEGQVTLGKTPSTPADQSIGVMNGLFVLGRTIGLIGHVLDQKRLKQPLYRHPWDDIAYLE